MNTSPGIFSVRAGTGLRFFDRIGEAQDWAETFLSATIRKEYGRGWTDIAKWDGSKWNYIHQKSTTKKARKKR